MNLYRCVDFVTIFTQITPVEIIPVEVLKAHVIFHFSQ